MRAAVLQAFGRPLAVRDVPRPEPTEGEVILRVLAVGLCATDLKLTNGDLPGVRLPRIPGHEVAGEVIDGGGMVDVGAHAACHIYSTCGSCKECLAGHTTLCATALRLGIERNGGLADYVRVPAATVLRFTGHVDPAHAAVSMDAVATPWSALHGRGALASGEHLLVIGAGGLGLNAVQIGRACGAHVAVLDVDERKLELAREFGAHQAVTPERAQELLEWSGGGVDIALEVSGAREGLGSASEIVRPGGRIVCCGYRPGEDCGIESTTLVLRELTLMGSRGATLDQARAALEAVERGEVRPFVDSRIPLEDVNRGLTSLRDGRVLGRIVIDIVS